LRLTVITPARRPYRPPNIAFPVNSLKNGIVMKIGFLGLGNMGTPMALRLLAAGHELSVWNRSEARTKPLIHEGAIAAATPAEAELGSDAIITMLSDDAAYEEVLFGVHRLIDALSPGALHISCSTISVALSERITVEYATRGIDFVGAPVFGRPGVAEEGGLWVVAAGADNALNRARPLLEAFSRGITVVGNEPRQAHAVRLGGSFLTSVMIHSLGEASLFAARHGVEPETFLEAVNNALFQSPLYAHYARMMLHPPEEIEAATEPGARDLRLLREAAASRKMRLRLADRLAEIFAEVQTPGPADEDSP
jgi:3-hydroxyisobutyrate dehydrogenase-like beta-hydroxyacid dehydrogenase